MAITLTESRLRQIIREEVRLLGRKPRRSIKESAKLVPSVRAMSSAKRVLRKFGVPLDSTGLDRVFNVVLDYGPFRDAAAFKSQLKQSLDTDTLSDLRSDGASTDEFFAAFLGAFQTDRLPEGKSLVEAYRRGRGGGGVTRRSNNEDDQIAHIMRERGVNYERAEQILTDIYDDVGHDDGLVADAVYGHPMDYDED